MQRKEGRSQNEIRDPGEKRRRHCKALAGGACLRIRGALTPARVAKADRRPCTRKGSCFPFRYFARQLIAREGQSCALIHLFKDRKSRTKRTRIGVVQVSN